MRLPPIRHALKCLFACCLLLTGFALPLHAWAVDAAGSLDPGFNPGTGANNTVQSIALQADGKLLVSGSFTTVNGVARNRIARLNSDGSLDTGFSGTGADNIIYSVALQADGKVLIGGDFTAVNGVFRNYIARLHNDGSLDTGFGTGANNIVCSVAQQVDGKVLIGGDFTAVNGVGRNRIARLNSDGSLDTGFNLGTGASGAIRSIAQQADGKVLIGGDFTTVNGVARNRIARLNGDGSLDTGFNPVTGASSTILSIALADERVLVGGDFTSYNGTSINRIVRIRSGDADQDGIQDAADYFSNNAAAVLDTDHDGLPDAWLQPNAFGCAASASTCNGLTLDTDDDNDGVLDISDNCPPIVNNDQLNTDGDVQGNVCDADDDNDGVADSSDAFPLHAAASSDADADGSPDSWNAACNAVCQGNAGLIMDNCPLIANADQADDDHDGVGNVCDSDGPGKRDIGFNTGTGADGTVYSVAAQADGKVLIGGDFSEVNGVARKRLARLNSDGSLDTGFNPGTTGADDTVYSVAAQVDGKVLIGGRFTTVNGVARNKIARLNSNGSLDAGFNSGTGANDIVHSVVVQADGKVLIGGDFTTVNGVARNRLARLHSNGSLDTGFNPGTGANDTVYSMALQADGKVLIGGDFSTVNGVARNHIARLNSNGSLDTGFNPDSNMSRSIESVAVQADGQVLIGGSFFMVVVGVAPSGIARLHSDGSLDTGFNPSIGETSHVLSVIVQADGKVLIGGDFTAVNGVARNKIARLNSDGSLDTGFNLGTGASGAIRSIAQQADGKVLVGGSDFTDFYGPGINRIARIHTGDADQDGIQNAADYFSNNPAAALDTDRDGLSDAWLQPNAFGCAASASSCNGLTLDTDDDNDGVPDTSDNCPLAVNTDQADTDGDSLPDACTDTDDDNDGVADGSDRFPLDATESSDVDGDDLGDNADPDADNDGVPDNSDNCPLYAASIDQTDDDHDGVGNVCDSDGPGKRDTSFNLGTGANSTVWSVAQRADGKALIGGDFTTVNGVARNRIARLNSDGSLDTGFNPGTGANNTVYSMAQQADGKVLIGGSFSKVNGVARNHIARLNSDGSLDTGFNPDTGANDAVCSVAVQADGKVLIGGDFTTVNGVARNRIARLNSNGSLDTGFDSGTGASRTIRSIAPQADGKVLIGGQFTTVNGVARNRIARLNSNGSLDTGFNPGTGANDTVYSMAQQADGKVLIGGAFTTVNGVVLNRIVRLNSDGSLDTGFNSGIGANDIVFSVAVQADGKVLIGGAFTTVNGVVRNRIARLNSNGSLDIGFDPGTSADNVVVYSLAVQANGKLLMGGAFTYYGGTNINNRIVQIHTGDADQDGIQNAADYVSNNAAAVVDTDRDGLPDAWLQPNVFDCVASASACNGLALDTDDDNDGVPDYIDAAPLNASNASEIIFPVDGSYRGGAISEAQNLQ